MPFSPPPISPEGAPAGPLVDPVYFNDYSLPELKIEPRSPPVVPQPREAAIPVPTVPQAPSHIPPGHKWAIVPEDTPELEPSKPNEELKAAQDAADKLQGMVEAAVICLLEQRTEYNYN